jgi:hypothetical protein
MVTAWCYLKSWALENGMCTGMWGIYLLCGVLHSEQTLSFLSSRQCCYMIYICLLTVCSLFADQPGPLCNLWTIGQSILRFEHFTTILCMPLAFNQPFIFDFDTSVKNVWIDLWTYYVLTRHIIQTTRSSSSSQFQFFSAKLWMTQS